MPVFRVFIDEFGHHDLKSSNHPNERYLGLTGVIMPLDYEQREFTQALNSLKDDIFGRIDIVLHRREILNASVPFECLRDERVRLRFNAEILNLLANSRYRVFTVIIDKLEHNKRYVVWRFHPYHYCLTVLLERYVQLLHRIGQTGDVMAESRGEKENRQLERAYQYIYNNGSDHVPAKLFQERLTSKELKLRPKAANVAGLQMADLIVNPSCRALICERTHAEMTAEFGKRVVQVLKKNKYLKNPFNGSIPGWGTKWLP